MSEKKSLNIILNFLSMLFFLWIFLLSIKLLGGTFKHYFIGDAAKLIEDTTGNPIVSLVIGILATAIIQSSSSTTTIVCSFCWCRNIAFCKCNSNDNGSKYRYFNNWSNCFIWKY